MRTALHRIAFSLAALAACVGCDPAAEPIRVRVTPSEPRLVPHQTVAFHASVRSSTGDEVEWFLEGVEGGDVLGEGAIGTLSSSGVFTAPARVPPDWANAVTIYACSTVDPTECGETTVTFEPAPVEPARGRRYEFTWVRIGGEDLVEGSRVFFGGVESEETYFDSEVVIWGNAPDSDVLGAVDVVVQRPDGSEITWPKAFSYGAEVVTFDGGQLVAPCAGAIGRPAYGTGSDGAVIQVLAVPCVGEDRVAVLFGDEDGAFLVETPAAIPAMGVAPAGAFLADVFGAAGDEIVVARAGGLDVYGFPTEKTAPYSQVQWKESIGDPGLAAGANVRGAGVTLDGDAHDLVWLDGGRGLLFFADGTGTGFVAPQSRPVDGSSVALATLDGSDVAVVFDGGAHLFLATGGTLVAGATVASIGGPVDAAAGDVDGDLADDLVVAGGTTVGWLRRAGSGFDPMITYGVGANVEGVHAANVNGDAFADAVVATADGVLVLEGSVSGFAASQPAAALAEPRSVIAAALDADSAADLLIAHDATIEIRRGATPAWAWPSIGAGGDPRSVALAIDFDSAPVAFAAVETTAGAALLVLDLDAGDVLQSIALPPASARLQVEAADLDEDGVAEAIVSDGGPRAGGDASVLIFPGLDASGRVGVVPIGIAAPMPVLDFAIGQLDDDGLPDIAMVLAGTGANAAPSGVIAIAHSEDGYAVLDEISGVIATHIALADAGFDGSDDLFLSDAAQPRVLHIPVYDGFVDLVESLEATVGTLAGELIVRDVNGDYAPDIVVLPDGESRAGVMIGGEYHWDPPVWYAFRGDGRAIGWADVDGDALGDLVVTTSLPGVAIFRGRDGGTFSGPAYAIGGLAPDALAIGDLDGDGTSDVCVADRIGALVTLTNRSY